VTRARENRLARLAEAAAKDDAAKSFERSTATAWGKVCAIVREELIRSGIDPAWVAALHLCEAHQALEAEPAREEFVEPGDDPLAAAFAAKIGNMARRYKDGHEPNFAKASMAELFAWCLSRRAARAGCST
jgi:hypothetical protein